MGIRILREVKKKAKNGIEEQPGEIQKLGGQDRIRDRKEKNWKYIPLNSPESWYIAKGDEDWMQAIEGQTPLVGEQKNLGLCKVVDTLLRQTQGHLAWQKSHYQQYLGRKSWGGVDDRERKEKSWRWEGMGRDGRGREREGTGESGG